VISTESWLWYSTARWPGFSEFNQSNLGTNGNGLSISPSSYTSVTLLDASGDGRIADVDTDDASSFTNDRILIDGVQKTVKEIGGYNGSTVVVNGVSYGNIRLAVFLFTDGTYGVRIHDDTLIANEHYKKVTAVTLGTFDGIEYSHTFVSNMDAPFICFAAGTRIDTAEGPRPVETLRPGDLVPTLDHGLQPIRWTGARWVNATGRFAPIEFRPDALENLNTVRLSPEHRVLVSGWRAELLFGTPEVLVPAHKLINDHNIIRAPRPKVRYVHLLFEQHEIIGSEGLLSESFHPAPGNSNRLDDQTRAEILAIFPELGTNFEHYGATARPCLKGWESHLLLEEEYAGPPRRKLRINAR
jgi:hypothetical protein